MKLRLVSLSLAVLLWTCTTPPSRGPAPAEAPLTRGPDDDHRAVAVTEFLASRWTDLPAVQTWTATDQGVALVLADGTQAALGFVASGVVRWRLGEGDPRSAVYGEAPRVRVTEAPGFVVLETPVWKLRLELATLAWSLERSGQPVLTAQGPQRAGRRLAVGFGARDYRWTGPSLQGGAARHWPEGEGFATPSLFGVAGPVSVALWVDTGYQSYTATDAQRVLVGTLNGGLDVLVSVGSRPEGVVQELTALTGRPGVAPDWVHGTSLRLPGAQTGAFVRKAKLSIEGAWGAPLGARPGFRPLVTVDGLVGDPSEAGQRTQWADQVPAEAQGLVLGPTPPRDWGQTFDDGGRRSPLAAVAPLLPLWEAQGLVEALRQRAPTTRPVVLATSGGASLVRSARPLVTVGPSSATTLGDVLALGVAGLGTPAVRLDLGDLGPDGSRAALDRLNQWLLAPGLLLDWGTDPEATWQSLSDSQRRQVKVLLDQRSRFKPYLVQLGRTTSLTGRPAWAPLWFDFPQDPQARLVDDEYLLGSLLVAPGTAGSRKVYLPGGGVWFDFWTGEEFGGGRTYDLEVRGDRPLVFARAGALVTLREPEVFDGKEFTNPPTVHVFPAARGTGTYWMDDGVSDGWKGGSYQETRLLFDFDQKSMSLEHQSLNASRYPADPYLLYRLHNLYKPRQVRMAGKAVPLFGDSWGITDTDRSAAWYESDHTLLIKVFRPERDQTIEILF